MKVYLYFFSAVFLFSLVGCKRPMKNPELIDPIYLDILKESKSYDEQYRKFIAEAEAVKIELEKADPISGNSKAIRTRYYKKIKEAETARQMQVYYELHAKERKLDSRKSYLKAFKKDLPWPNPTEYEYYRTAMALKKSNRSWDARTKRWSSRIPSSKIESKDEKPSTSNHSSSETNAEATSH